MLTGPSNFPETGETLEIARLNDATKYVVTSNPDTLTWKNSVPINGDNLLSEVEQLKREDGSLLQIHGSWNLIQQLLMHGLIDEFRLWTFPVMVGSGKKLFNPDLDFRKLVLSRSRVTENGATMTFYN